MMGKSFKCAACSQELIGTRQQNQQEEEKQRLNEGDRELEINVTGLVCVCSNAF